MSGCVCGGNCARIGGADGRCVKCGKVREREAFVSADLSALLAAYEDELSKDWSGRNAARNALNELAPVLAQACLDAEQLLEIGMKHDAEGRISDCFERALAVLRAATRSTP